MILDPSLVNVDGKTARPCKSGEPGSTPGASSRISRFKNTPSGTTGKMFLRSKKGKS